MSTQQIWFSPTFTNGYLRHRWKSFLNGEQASPPPLVHLLRCRRMGAISRTIVQGPESVSYQQIDLHPSKFPLVTASSKPLLYYK